jgi:hypothetical protein
LTSLSGGAARLLSGKRFGSMEMPHQFRQGRSVSRWRRLWLRIKGVRLRSMD